MGTMKQNPRYNVISLRISDDEWQSVQELKARTSRSISNIMRDALVVFMQEEAFANGDAGFCHKENQ